MRLMQKVCLKTLSPTRAVSRASEPVFDRIRENEDAACDALQRAVSAKPWNL